MLIPIILPTKPPITNATLPPISLPQMNNINMPIQMLNASEPFLTMRTFEISSSGMFGSMADEISLGAKFLVAELAGYCFWAELEG